MRNIAVGLLVLGAAALAACQDNAEPTTDQLSSTPALARAAKPLSGTPTERAAQIAARVNARLEKAGSTKRLDEVWMFSLGRGTPEYRRLRTGSRWSHPRNVTYMIDDDYTADVPAPQVRAAVVASFERYDAVRNITLELNQLPYNGGNNDILDGVILNSAGECVDIVDLDADILNSYDPATGEIDFDVITDNYFGGWYGPQYFEDCLGDALILGVTWTFSDVDGALGEGTDGYRDRIYTEQYYNDGFEWVNGGSPFLSDLIDIQAIVTHEVGHAVGLGHFGGPNPNQPFKLQPNGKVFDPTAIMNPFYLGGDDRELYPTDIAGLRALYASKTK
jgi:hypothetical protein